MTTTVPAEIASFAAGVRAALADLPQEEVEELTEGLEADLAEAFREDLARELGDPAVYAAELRAAAGLPAPVADGETRAGLVASGIDTVRAFGRDVRAFVADHPGLAKVVAFVVSLRPAWWLVRAWAAWVCLDAVVGFGGLLLLVALAAGSVWLGLRTWPGWFSGVIVVGNVVAAVVVLGMAASFPASLSSGYADESFDYAEDLTGVYLDGQQVTNIFAYDAAGQPLSDVQLFDQDGNPLATSVDGGNGCLDADCLTNGLWLPMQLVTGQDVFNVFPMTMVEARWDEHGNLVPVSGARPTERVAPFLQVPALQPPATDTVPSP